MAADQAQAGQAPTANYAYAIVRPNLLSAPEHETLGNLTDGRTSCRHSAKTKIFTITAIQILLSISV